MVKLQKTKSGAFFMYIPASIVRLKGWERGKELQIKANTTGDLVIKD